MDEKKLAKIRREINEARQKSGNLRHKDLANIAKKLGRIRSKKRTNEPTFISELLDTNPITIPDHPGNLNKFTAKNILNQFEEDVYKLEIMLEEQANGIIYANSKYEN